MATPASPTREAVRRQRIHELTRAYEDVQRAANRLELAGMDAEAAEVRRIRSEVYRLALELSVDLDPTTRTLPSVPRALDVEQPLLPSRTSRRRPSNAEVALSG